MDRETTKLPVMWDDWTNLSCFCQALNFLVESLGHLNNLFSFPSIPDEGYPVFYLHLADVLFDVILPSVLGSFL
jgi:hypothetical protein